MTNTEKIKAIENHDNTVENGEIITGRVGTIGNFSLYDNLIKALISDSIFKIQIKPDSINNIFLLCVLNSEIIFQQLKRNSRGAVQEVINTQTLKNIKIPLPPLSIQEEIATHITSIRTEAKRLELEAKEELERAKMEVERMILGE